MKGTALVVVLLVIMAIAWVGMIYALAVAFAVPLYVMALVVASVSSLSWWSVALSGDVVRKIRRRAVRAPFPRARTVATARCPKCWRRNRMDCVDPYAKDDCADPLQRRVA